MDPSQAYVDYVNAMCEADYDQAQEIIENLLNWYDNGGFPAKFPGSDKSVPLGYIVTLDGVLRAIITLM